MKFRYKRLIILLNGKTHDHKNATVTKKSLKDSFFTVFCLKKCNITKVYFINVNFEYFEVFQIPLI